MKKFVVTSWVVRGMMKNQPPKLVPPRFALNSAMEHENAHAYVRIRNQSFWLA
jgi:hypothetical protein